MKESKLLKNYFSQGNYNYDVWLFSQVKCKENDNKPTDKQLAPAEDIENECNGTSRASIYSPLVAAGHVIMVISDGW